MIEIPKKFNIEKQGPLQDSDVIYLAEWFNQLIDYLEQENKQSQPVKENLLCDASLCKELAVIQWCDLHNDSEDQAQPETDELIERITDKAIACQGQPDSGFDVVKFKQFLKSKLE